MKSLLLLLVIVGAAHAHRFAAKGPCRDIAACEKACKANKVANLYTSGTVVAREDVKADGFRERYCQIKTGKPCPPSEAR